MPERRKRTRKNKVVSQNENLNTFDPKNAYAFYTHLRPTTEKLREKYPDMFPSLQFYKGVGYTKMNTFLIERSHTTLPSLLEDMPHYAKEIQNEQKMLIEKTRFKSAYMALKESDLLSKAKQSLLVTIAHIDNIQRLFKLYKAPSGFVLPTLYRGLVTSPQFNDPFETMEVGESVAMKGISSCSLQPATAVKFQRCSSEGPCCLLRLKVDEDVKFIPLFWESGESESYVGSEHEIILEPMAEFKLLKKSTVRISQSVGIYCSYNKFNKTGHITLKLYDIQVSKPKKEVVAEFNEFLDSFEKDMRTPDIELKLRF